MPVVGRIEFRGDRAIAEHEHAGAEVQELFDLARQKHYRLALRGKVPEIPVEIELGAHIDAARGII